jgi:stage III sporulation protein AF
MIISPVLKIFNSDIETAIENMIFNDRKNSSESLLDEKKIEILESQRAYILEQMAVQLERQVAKDVKEKYGVEISGISLESNDKELKDYNSISKVSVTYKESTSNGTKDIVEEVSPVSINVSKPITVSENHQTNNKEIATYLSKSWGISKVKISIKEEGGVNP